MRSPGINATVTPNVLTTGLASVIRVTVDNNVTSGDYKIVVAATNNAVNVNITDTLRLIVTRSAAIHDR